METPTTPIAPIGLSDTDIAPTLPVGPVMLSNSDFAKTLPFKDNDVSRELRATILKRTKERWVWFSRAEELDKERGTQLGTLGHLPWGIRQMIIEKVFDGEFHKKIFFRGYERTVIETLDTPPKFFVEDDFPGPWSYPYFSICELRFTSASTKVEVEYTLLTKTNFEFESFGDLRGFLGRLTTYQQSLLRSVTISLLIDPDFRDMAVDSKEWMDVCAQLPSGLTSIKFELSL